MLNKEWVVSSILQVRRPRCGRGKVQQNSRRQLHTTCLRVILRRVAKKCELEDIQDKGEQEKGDISLGERPEGKGKGLKGAWP